MHGGKDGMRGRACGPSAQAGRQTPATAEPARLGRRSLTGVLCGGVAGFLLGAAFWIALGLQELTGSGAAGLAPVREPHGLHVPPPGCTSLALDRRQGHTTAEPCLGEGSPMREARANSFDRASLH
jgi:hypothetical protein